MTKHKALIVQILNTIPGTSSHGFKKKSIDAIKRTQGGFWSRQIEADFRNDLNFVPDAYYIDKVAREITVYEVEVRHHIDRAKLKGLAYAWIYLDCIEWNLRLIVVNRFGNRSEVNLCDEYHRMVNEPYTPKQEPPIQIPEVGSKKAARQPRGSKVFWWENDLK